MPANVILIGMMGSGKTTVGRVVAERTGREFIDLDQMIVDRTGKQITQLFQEIGEDGFRNIETKALKELTAATHAVISTGGGIVTRAENRRLLRESGIVIWLDAPPRELLKRIGNDDSRPMLHGGDPLKRIESLVAERREMYADASDIHLDTTEFTPEEIAERIEKEMEGRGESFDSEVFSQIVAIDGPVGSGKSALAQQLAEQLGYIHVDTGAMYRCVALEALRRNIDFTDGLALTNVAHSIDIRFQDSEELQEEGFEGQRVLLNGDDVTKEIRTPEVTKLTSILSEVPGVRAEMVQLQREIGLRGKTVLEGRDIGTVVVPEAEWKIYLVASLEERVERRYAQYLQQGKTLDKNQLRADIIERDNRDCNRPQGALKLASDAMLFDTTDIPLGEVVSSLTAIISQE